MTDRERDTVLAALRHWQAATVEDPEWGMASEHGKPLDDDEIDALCERLNSADPLLEIAKELLTVADDSDVRQLYKEKGEQALINRVIVRARKIIRERS
jgi:hypothetical protein